MHEQSRYSHVCVACACLLFTSSLRNIVFLLFTIANATNYVSSCPKISRNLSLFAVLSFVCFSDPQPPTISQIFGSPLKTTCCFGRIEFTFLHKRHNTDLASNIVFYTNFTTSTKRPCNACTPASFFLPTTPISRTEQKISLQISLNAAATCTTTSGQQAIRNECT